MSTSVAYFFNSDADLQELTSEINICLGSNLKVGRRHEWEQSWCMFFGMSLDFYAHSLVNDGAFEVEKFKYQIGLAGPSNIGSLRVSLIAMIAYLLFLRLGIGEGLLAYNVQIPLAIYETRAVEDDYVDLYDTISRKWVEFPQHFLDLESILESL